MPYLPKKSPKRPWMPKRKTWEGRVHNKFYYTAAWQRTRAAYIRENPLCRHCEAQGKITPSKEIDHIIPINPTDSWDTQDGRFGHPTDNDNLQALCKPCHLRKTGKEKGREYR